MEIVVIGLIVVFIWTIIYQLNRIITLLHHISYSMDKELEKTEKYKNPITWMDEK